MILTDTGAIFALLNANDRHHSRCAEALAHMPNDQTMITTLPCIAESLYLLGRRGGYAYQARLWRLIRSNDIILHGYSPAEVSRMDRLMEQYADTPMDLADASLIAAAETLNLRQVFTIDTDFYIYRLSDGSALEVIPGPGPT